MKWHFRIKKGVPFQVFSCVTYELYIFFKICNRNSSLGHSLAVYLRCPFRSFFNFMLYFVFILFSLVFLSSSLFFSVEGKNIANSLVKIFLRLFILSFQKENYSKRDTHKKNNDKPVFNCMRGFRC